MAIVTFWNNGKAETGQSMILASTATVLALNYNYKILMINTKHNDKSLEYAFDTKNNINAIFTKGKTDLETGLSGVAKAIMSNKTSPEIIKNYTKIIFNNLELLTDKNVSKEDFDRYIVHIKDIIKLANRFYDMVFVDLDDSIEDTTTKQILEFSNVDIVTLPQNINRLDDFMEEKANNNILKDDRILVAIGKYDEKSKYNEKNVSKYIKQKRVFKVPYNTVFSMDAPEGKVADYFIKFRRINGTHINAPFVNSINDLTKEMVKMVKEQQRKIY